MSSTDGFGSGNYTDGYDATNERVAEQGFSHPLVTLYPGTTARRLLIATLAAHDLVDSSLGEVADAQHLATATEGHLDAIGASLGVEPTDESDAHHRARIRAAGGLTRKRPTYEGLHTYVGDLLETSASNYALSLSSGGVAQVTATSSTYSDATLTQSEIESYVTEFLPEGHRATTVVGAP